MRARIEAMPEIALAPARRKGGVSVVDSEGDVAEPMTEAELCRVRDLEQAAQRMFLFIKADAKFKMSEITPKVKFARCKTP